MRRSLLFAPVLLAAACGGESAHGPSALPGSVWKLDSLRSAAGLATTVDPNRYTLEFQEALRVRAPSRLQRLHRELPDGHVHPDHDRAALLHARVLRVGQPGRRIRRAPEHHEALRPGGQHPDPVLRRRHAALPAVEGCPYGR